MNYSWRRALAGRPIFRAVMWFCAAIAAALCVMRPLQDPDLWWHVTIGSWIAAHRTLPVVDLWTIAGLNHPWKAYSWSNEIVYALIESHFGLQGLLMLKLGLLALLVLSLFFCLGRMANDWFMGGVLSLYVICGSYYNIELRPQVLVWACMAWVLYLADRIRREGLSFPRGLALAALMCVWANSHLSSVLGICAAVMWISGRGKARTALAAGGLGVIATLITPYAGGEWVNAYWLSRTSTRARYIRELWQANFGDFGVWLLLILLVVMTGLAARRPGFVRLFAAAGSLAFVALAFTMVKFLPFAFIVLASFTAEYWRDLRAALKEDQWPSLALRQAKTVFFSAPGLAVLVLVLYGGVGHFRELWSSPSDESVAPVKAVDFIEKLKLPQPILSNYEVGGYLGYRLRGSDGSPASGVIVDSRATVQPRTVLYAMVNAVAGNEEWKTLINSTQPETILWKSQQPFVSLLLAEREWCRVYPSDKDESNFSVFVKQDYYRAHRQELPVSDNCR